MNLLMDISNFIKIYKEFERRTSKRATIILLQDELDELVSNIIRETNEIIDKNPEINITTNHCLNSACFQIGSCIYNPNHNNYFLNNNGIVLN